MTCVRVPLEESSCPGRAAPGLIFKVGDVLLAWSLGCQHEVLMNTPRAQLALKAAAWQAIQAIAGKK